MQSDFIRAEVLSVREGGETRYGVLELFLTGDRLTYIVHYGDES